MTARIATRFSTAHAETTSAMDILRDVESAPLNFGDADDPNKLAARLRDMAIRVDAAAGHLRAAAMAAREQGGMV